MRLLLTGASGHLGVYLLQELAHGPGEVTAWSGSRTGELLGFRLQPINLTDRDQVAVAFRDARPDVVIHCAALSSVAECHRDPQRAQLINVEGTAVLAQLAQEAGARFVFVSTDLVFDGGKGNYREADRPAPLSVYGRTKAEAEQVVLAMDRSVVARFSLLFGPSLDARPSFFDEQVNALRQHKPITLFEDEWRTPLGLPTAARALVALAKSDFTGLIHIGGPERFSRLEMGRRLSEFLGIAAPALVTSSRQCVPAPEPRPRDASLDSGLWRTLFPELPWPGWREALAELAIKR